MIVLALDTTTREGSCALARASGRVVEQAGDPQVSHAARLPGDLMTLLERESVSLPEIDVFAVAIGPGSFTGLRVGIATMQALALAGGKPLIGVSALDALASIARWRHAPADPPAASRAPLVATWVDAWRGEVYAALYAGERQVEEPTVEHPDAVLARLRGRRVLFTGDGAAAHASRIAAALAGDALLAHPVAPLLAGAIARRAAAAARAGAAPSPHAIRPLYVRRPDAELARNGRASG